MDLGSCSLLLFFINIALGFLILADVVHNRAFCCCTVAFKALGMLMMEVGLMLAYHCDQYGMFSLFMFFSVDVSLFFKVTLLVDWYPFWGYLVCELMLRM